LTTRRTKKIENSVLSSNISSKDQIDKQQFLSENYQLSNRSYLEKLDLEKQIKYANLNLILHQNPQISKEKIANTNSVYSVKDNLSYRFLEAVKGGIGLFIELGLLILKAWGFILLGLLTFIYYPKLKKKAFILQKP
jgi:hypothetical protein